MASDSGEDYYSDSAPSAQAAPAKPDENAPTALIPKSFFGGKDLTPGKECTIRVEQVMEDQVAVSYVQHREEESERDEEMEGLMS
jgi:hypothetical protein